MIQPTATSASAPDDEDTTEDEPGEPSEEVPTARATVRKGRPGRPNRRWWVGAVALTVGAIALGVALGSHSRNDLKLDIADEGAHYAYVVALRSGHLPSWGDTYTVAERRMYDCQGLPTASPVRCTKRPGRARIYPAQGYQYEAQQPPLGYLPYVIAANPNAPPATALADARRGGIIWIALSGLVLLAFAAVDMLPLLGLAAVLATSLFDPVFTGAASTVNNDAAGVAAGGLALLVWALARRAPRAGLWLGLGAGVLLGLAKGTFALAPLALVVAALVDGAPELRSVAGVGAFVRRNSSVLAMLAAAVITFAAFWIIQEVRATVAPSVVLHALLGFNTVSTLQPNTIGVGLDNALYLFVPNYPVNALNYVWGLAAIGVVVGICALPLPAADRRWVRGLAGGILVAIVVLAVGWPLVDFIQGHYNFFASERYLIPLLPLIGYVIARGCHRYGTAVVGVALPVACAAVELSIGKY